jgi:hypothetical protein
VRSPTSEGHIWELAARPLRASSSGGAIVFHRSENGKTARLFDQPFRNKQQLWIED